MAGVRKLRELSARRQARGTLQNDAYSVNEDDDSRPISPDKQLKLPTGARIKASTVAGSRQPPNGLGLTGILPKHYLKSQTSAATASSAAAKAKPAVATNPKKPFSSSNAKSTSRAAVLQLRTVTVTAAPPTLGSTLRQSQGLPSRESSSSSIGAGGKQRSSTPASAHGINSRQHKAAPAGHGLSRRNSSNSGVERLSNSGSSSKASSRAATPPAGPATAAASRNKRQQAVQSVRRSRVDVHAANAEGALCPPHADVLLSSAADAARAAAAIEAGAASMKELLKLQQLQQQRWQHQHQQQPKRVHQQKQQKTALAPAVMQQEQQHCTVEQDEWQQHQQQWQQEQWYLRQPHEQHSITQQMDVADCASQDAGKASITSAEFEEFSRDVAARIIQSHWRWWRDARRNQRQQQQLQLQQDPAEPDAASQFAMAAAADGSCYAAAASTAANEDCCSDASVDCQQQQQQREEADALRHVSSYTEDDCQQQDDVSFTAGRQHDMVQQLLGQLQLDAESLAVLNGDTQLRALLAAALQQTQQQEAEDQVQQQQSRQDSAELEREQQQWQQESEQLFGMQQQQQHQEQLQGTYSDDDDADDSIGSCNAEQQHITQQHPDDELQFSAADCKDCSPPEQMHYADDQNSSFDVSKATEDQQQLASPLAAYTAAAVPPSCVPEQTAAQCLDVSSSKPVAIGRLRRSPDGRHAHQLQQYMAASNVAAVGSQQAPPEDLAVVTPAVPSTTVKAAAAVQQEASRAGISAGAGCSSMSAEKLGTILAYLDAVDAEAEVEAAAAIGPGLPLPPQQQLLSRELSQTFFRSAGIPSGSSVSRVMHLSRPVSRGATAGIAAAPARYPSAARPASAAAAVSTTAPTAAAEAPGNSNALLAGWEQRSQQTVVKNRPATASRPQQQQQMQQQQQLSRQASVQQQQQQEHGLQQQQQLSAGNSAADLHASANTGVGLLGEPSAAVSVGGYSMMSQGNRSAVLAESVFDGVRAKMSQLKAQLADKERAMQAMHQELADSRERHAQQLARLAEVHEQELASAANDSAAAVSRHLAFIDRLMEDKQQLSRHLAEQQAAIKASDEKHAAAIAALKAGWAAELKKQQAAWEASAAAKQEAWRTAKTAEIKEQTVKGLEVEVQRLIARHRAELASTMDKAAEQSKAAVEAARVQHEAAMAALKERMRKDQEDALERERVAAASRLREAGERYEAQMHAARIRLLADADMKLEAAAAAARDDKRRAESALEEAASAARQREVQLREEWAREKEALERSHVRAVEAAKAAAQDERSAWRAAVTEKIKRQASEREEQLRCMLIAERDAELQEVIKRLEEEQSAALASTAKQIAADHAATISSLQAQLKEAQRGTARLGDKARAAGQVAAAAEQQHEEMMQRLEQLRHELELRDQQLSAAHSAIAAKEAEAQAAAAAAGAAAAAALKELASDKGQLEGRVAAQQQQIDQLKQQHEAEMVHVEYRVKGVIAKKDEAILRLQQQLSVALEQMRGTEAVLAAQQAELCD